MTHSTDHQAVIPPGKITVNDIVYISGPMTGLPDCNRPAFNCVARWLSDNVGCRVLNPARWPDGWEYGHYMRRAYIDLCHATAVVLLPGWAGSRGALAEVQAAGILGLPVVPIEEVVGAATDRAVEIVSAMCFVSRTEALEKWGMVDPCKYVDGVLESASTLGLNFEDN